MLSVTLRTLAASLGAGLTAFGIARLLLKIVQPTSIPPQALLVFGPGIAGLGVYLLLARLLRVQEVFAAIRQLLGRFSRRPA